MIDRGTSKQIKWKFCFSLRFSKLLKEKTKQKQEAFTSPRIGPLKPGLPWGFPGGAVAKNLSSNAGDTGSSPGPGGSHMPRSN